MLINTIEREHPLASNTSLPDKLGVGVCQTRGCLTSAAGGLHILSRALCNVESCEVLRTSWVDTDSGIKVGFCCPHANGYIIALSDLACIGTENMKPHHTLLGKKERTY